MTKSIYKDSGRYDDGEKDDIIDHIIDSNCERVYLTDNLELRATKLFLDQSDMDIYIAELSEKHYKQQLRVLQHLSPRDQSRVTIFNMDIFDMFSQVCGSTKDVYFWADLEVCELTKNQLAVLASKPFWTTVTLAGGRKKKRTVNQVVRSFIRKTNRVWYISGYKRRYNGKCGQLMMNVWLQPQKVNEKEILYDISYAMKRGDWYGIKYLGFKDIEWYHVTNFHSPPVIKDGKITFHELTSPKPITVDFK